MYSTPAVMLSWPVTRYRTLPWARRRGLYCLHPWERSNVLQRRWSKVWAGLFWIFQSFFGLSEWIWVSFHAWTLVLGFWWIITEMITHRQTGTTSSNAVQSLQLLPLLHRISLWSMQECKESSDQQVKDGKVYRQQEDKEWEKTSRTEEPAARVLELRPDDWTFSPTISDTFKWALTSVKLIWHTPHTWLFVHTQFPSYAF